MHGGHRLWAAPEVPETTYLPDDGPVDVERAADRVSCSYLEPETGLRRTIGVAPTADSVVVDHRLVNEGQTPVDVAPWAITMCTPGGEAWVPRPVRAADPHGVLPNGSLVTWPYTRLSDDRLVLEDPILRIRAVAGAATPCKVGVAGCGRLDRLPAGRRGAHQASPVRSRMPRTPTWVPRSSATAAATSWRSRRSGRS